MSEPVPIGQVKALDQFRVPASVPPFTPPTFEALLAAAREGHELPRQVPLTDAQNDELDEALAEARWQRWAPKAGVPKRLLIATLDGGKPTPAIKRIAEFCIKGDLAAGRCLVLTGPTGVGKTFAAVAALRMVGQGRFWYFPAVCGALLDPDRRGAMLEAVKATRFVVFDDFGVEYVKEGGLVDAFLDEIIWHREAESLPTIITTNLTTDALKVRLPARLVDRLRGDWGRIFECPGESLR